MGAIVTIYRCFVCHSAAGLACWSKHKRIADIAGSFCTRQQQLKQKRLLLQHPAVISKNIIDTKSPVPIMTAERHADG
jgi:hypothetical protein